MLTTAFNFVTIFVYIFGIVSAAHAICNVRRATSAVAWALSLILIPYLTLLPYLLFGRNHLQKKFLTATSKISIDTNNFSKNFSHEFDKLNAVSSSTILLKYLSKLSNFKVVDGNEVKLLINGEQIFTALFRALKNAKHTICLQSFAIHEDCVGLQLSEILCAQAQNGIAVYLLYDSIGSYKLSRKYIVNLINHGVAVQAFVAGGYFNNPLQINFRNHRKLCIIDSNIAFLGGCNIGATYINHHKRLSPWRDTHVQIYGPAVHQLENIFGQDWFCMRSSLPTHMPYEVDISSLERKKNHSLLNVKCQILACGPSDAQENCLLFFVAAISCATKRIWLSSPYFIPDDAIRSALQLAVLREVDVRIILPSMADHYTVYAASSLYAYEALTTGVKVYRYYPGFIHQKLIIIDEDITIIGSANLDNRSFFLNFELMLLTVNLEFATLAAEIMSKDFANAKLLTIDEYQSMPRWQKFAAHAAKLFSPIL